MRESPPLLAAPAVEGRRPDDGRRPAPPGGPRPDAGARRPAPAESHGAAGGPHRVPSAVGHYVGAWTGDERGSVERALAQRRAGRWIGLRLSGGGGPWYVVFRALGGPAVEGPSAAGVAEAVGRGTGLAPGPARAAGHRSRGG